MTLKQMMAAKQAASVPAVPASTAPAPARAAETGDHPAGPQALQPPHDAVLAAPRAGYLGRQDETEPLPESWPPDDAAFSKGSDLVVVQNPHLESFLAIRRPGKPLLYLIGPFETVNFPF